jgi:hypothetical protein
MKMDANGTLDKLMEGRADDINNSLMSDDANLTSESLMRVKRNTSSEGIPTGKMGVAAGNVPSIIRESFSKNPPVSEETVTSSVLDDMFGLMDVEPKQQRQQIREQAAPVQQSYASNGGGVDYPMIRTIVEDIVRKYSQSLKKNILNENTGVGEINTIALGKTFKFLDSKGNIYECTMKKVGNINNKKNVNG